MRLLAFCLTAILMLPTMSLAAMDGPSSYIGRWRQISSNAGQCTTCSINVFRGDSYFRIKANNGWTATLWPSEPSAPEGSLQGIGEWSSSAGGLYAGRKFRIELINDEGFLRMTMVVSPLAGKQGQRIRASYIRSVSN